MADIELTDDLILLQKRSDTAWVRVQEIQDRHGRPSAEGGWTDDAHSEWDTAWKVWGDQTDVVREAIAAWAGESGQSRINIEGRLKGEVRGGKGPQIWPEAKEPNQE
ncbi:hypothetical protein ACODT5_03325 [Streptomyces sp. 5.8]|uniref:hypothetical protein n=1 Tax=Streptomyces sp. 5.8 TaxID=3406571 RepID=UPI003BB7B75E